MEKSQPLKKLRREAPLYLMLAGPVVLVLVYSYGPMLGLVIAFQRFLPGKGLFGSPWIGLDNFRFMLQLPTIGQVVWNTVFIAGMKLLAGILVPVTVALLLNEVGSKAFKRSVQTIIYLPHFLSWVILAGIFLDILSPSEGVVNRLLGQLGLGPVFFLGDERTFPFTLVVTDVWKSFGFGTIVYLAALTGIDPTLYEAALADGAGRWRRIYHITLPGISSTVILLATLSLGNILNAGFDQVFNLYGPLVYKTGDIIDTLVYRTGLVNNQYGIATAMGLFKSLVALLLIGLSYKIAQKAADYNIF